MVNRAASNPEQRVVPAPDSPDDQLSFEQILERLETVVGALEQGDTPLEQALSTFERGVLLARLGTRRLDEAERRIELLLSDEQGLRTRPLDKELSSDE
jgi:exodeoxyribonuclease VII small subunit